MYNDENTIKDVVKKLSLDSCKEGIFHEVHDNVPLPSNDALREIITLAREVLFPGYFGQSKVSAASIDYHIGVSLERMFRLLKKQVMAGLCFAVDPKDDTFSVEDMRRKAKSITKAVMEKLPALALRKRDVDGIEEFRTTQYPYVFRNFRKKFSSLVQH